MINPKSLIQRILEAAVMLAVSGFLIRTAVCFVTSVWLQIVVIAVIIAICTAGYRLYRYFRDSGKWRDDHDQY